MKVRKEVHTRTRFAYDVAEVAYRAMQKAKIEESGNILSCKHMIRIAKARRIYIHYTNEYQKCQGLPLSK